MRAKELLEALALPFEVADRRAKETEVVSHIRLAGGKALAFNWRSAVEVKIGVDLDCCVPATRLQNALTAIAAIGGDAEAKISQSSSRLTISAPRARYVLPILPAQNLPEPVWPTDPQPLTDWKALASAMRFSVHACELADQRPFCNGIGLQHGYIAGTDGRRAAVTWRAGKLRDGLVVPMLAVPTIAGLPDCTQWSASETAFALHFEHGRFTTQQIATRYPDIQRFVPQEHTEEPASIEREALGRAASALLKTGERPFVHFKVTNDAVILDEENGDSAVHLEVACGSKNTWEGGMNVRHLTDACEQLDGTHIRLSCKGEAFLLTGDNKDRSLAIMAAKV